MCKVASIILVQMIEFHESSIEATKHELLRVRYGITGRISTTGFNAASQGDWRWWEDAKIIVTRFGSEA